MLLAFQRRKNRTQQMPSRRSAMIVKKVKYKKTTKPKSWQIGDLVDDIRSPRDSNPLEKIEYSGNREFFSTTHVGQKMEMIGLANESIHSKTPSALRSSPPAANLADAQAAYAVHRQEILRQQNVRFAALTAGMALFGKTWTAPPRSLSRQDAWIALLMRADGHSRAAVLNAIWRSAPESRREENRDWQRYATRTAAYAFGLTGDMELAKMSRMKPKPIEAPPPPVESVQVEPEPQWEAPRLRMR
jgi:hypothetical protein